MCAHRAVVRIENTTLMIGSATFGVHAYAGETNDRGSIDTIDLESIAK
jgi:hypothetical protein